MTTIKDVARKAQVSPATVSLVLNSSNSSVPISEATRQRVREAARELGYHPNTYAKTLRTRKSFVVGILAFDIVDPYCAHVMRGAEEIFNENGYYPMLCDLQNDEQKLHRYVTLFKERRVEGLLILASSLPMEDQLIAELHRHKIPLVVIGRELVDPQVPTVVTDNHHGAYLATEHLIQLGHRHMAFVLGPSKYIDSRQRWDGCRHALQAHGITWDQELLAEENTLGWGPEAGYSSMQELLSRGKPITAVVAFDDISAFGCIRSITESGLNVPADISVVGFDDLPMSAFYNPPLTTIRYSMVEMGRAGAGLLLQRLSEDSASPWQTQIVPPSNLVVRRSTAPPGGGR